MKGSSGPLAGWNGFWTCRFAGLVTPLLAMYWVLQPASTDGSMNCRPFDVVGMRFIRFALWEAL